jgi:hypothetical protein
MLVLATGEAILSPLELKIGTQSLCSLSTWLIKKHDVGVTDDLMRLA